MRAKLGAVVVKPQSSKAPGSIPFKSFFRGFHSDGLVIEREIAIQNPMSFKWREILSSYFQSANDNIGGITDCFAVYIQCTRCTIFINYVIVTPVYSSGPSCSNPG